MSDNSLISPDIIRAFQSDLLSWWEENKRSFPWRETSNPFYILISEIMLQRTRADQVVPIYEFLY